MPLRLDFRSNNSTLDMIAALLCFGLYPNVLYHIEKRKVKLVKMLKCTYVFVMICFYLKVLTTESKLALIHKASINCSRFEINFPFPFFIYGEKVGLRSCSYF